MSKKFVTDLCKEIDMIINPESDARPFDIMVKDDKF